MFSILMLRMTAHWLPALNYAMYNSFSHSFAGKLYQNAAKPRKCFVGSLIKNFCFIYDMITSDAIAFT